jgi:hypothetical protein
MEFLARLLDSEELAALAEPLVLAKSTPPRNRIALAGRIDATASVAHGDASRYFSAIVTERRLRPLARRRLRTS